MVFAHHRGEVKFVRTKVRRILYGLALPFRASEYLGLVLYRLRDVLKSSHVPLLPLAINAICAVIWGIRIGDPVVIDEGIYIPHGQIVIDGLVFIGKGSELCPWITIGLRQGDARGPWLEEGVFVGTGAKILGNVRLGSGAKVGANAVVVADVPAWATAVGVPARVIPNPNAPTRLESPEAISGDSAQR
jgi:serine O-acetyltransferase